MSRECEQSNLTSATVVMFSDIADSSRLYRELGEERASEVVNMVLHDMEQCIQRGTGKVLARIGDELLVVYDDPADAIATALQLEDATLRTSSIVKLGRSILLRTGLYSGRVLEREGKIYGDCVYAAKRVTDLAKAGQILVGPELAQVASTMGISCRFHQELTLKGQGQLTMLSELLRDAAEETLLASAQPVQRSTLRVELVYQQQRFTLEPGQCLRIGRMPPAQLLINIAQVSRLHATIRNEEHRVVIEDVSTNGTYLLREASTQPEFQRKATTHLDAEGWIGFGGPPKPRTQHSVQFRIELSPRDQWDNRS
ncbi:MAG: adenylate cyclase [Planctomycetota bacterium]|jgi:adenylate cyclase